MPAKKKSAESPIINLPRPRLDTVEIAIIGEKPLISNAFPQKALMAILAKHMKAIESTLPLEAKNPVANFQGCIHWMRGDDGQMHYSMPGSSFKASLVAACRLTNLEMTSAKQMFQVIPHRIRIFGDAPDMCEHRVRNTTGVIDIRHRAMYLRWAAILPIRFHAGSISKDMIYNLAMLAGFGCGIGDWRIAAPKSNNGQMGAWRLAEEHEAIGEDFTEQCLKNPAPEEERLEYGIVPQDRQEYYARAAAMAATGDPNAGNGVGNGKPRKGKKGEKRAPATVEEALAVINGIAPVDGVDPPDGYQPQE